VKIDLQIKGGTLVLPGQGISRAGLAIHAGKIVAIGQEKSLPSARRTIDASGLHVLPGLVDPHGHMGLSGDFAGECETETRAALKGGVTTVGLFLRTGEDHLTGLPKVAAEVERTAFVDVFFSAIIGDEEQTGEIPRYAEELGIRSFKFYLWGVPGMKTMDDALLFHAFRKVASLGHSAIACVHAENKSMVDAATARLADTPWEGSDLKRYTASHPALAEALAVDTAGRLAQATGTRLYIVHLSSREGLEAAARLKSESVDLTVETTPHHLVLTEDSPVGILAKIAPPVREKSHPEALWEGLAAGLIHTLGTDNLPRTVSQKQGDWQEAITGFPGYGTLLPLLLHEGYHKRKLPLEDLVEKVTANPARTFGWYPRKGALRPGSDADIVLVDLNKTRTVRWRDLEHWSDFSVYEGMRLKGWPVATIKDGKVAHQDGEILAEPGSGAYLRH
jgi:dihydroorotase (multifunctional complex type)